MEVRRRVVADHVDGGQRVAAARDFQHSATRRAGRIADGRVIAAVKRGHQVLDSIQLCSISARQTSKPQRNAPKARSRWSICWPLWRVGVAGPSIKGRLSVQPAYNERLSRWSQVHPISMSLRLGITNSHRGTSSNAGDYCGARLH